MIGASRSTRPAATACMTAVAVNSFDIDWTLKIVSAVTGAEPRPSTWPKPSTHNARSLSTSATARPGIPCSASISGICARYLAITAAAGVGRDRTWRRVDRTAREGQCRGGRDRDQSAPTASARSRSNASHWSRGQPDAASVPRAFRAIKTPPREPQESRRIERGGVRANAYSAVRNPAHPRGATLEKGPRLRAFSGVGDTGFEPVTPSLSSWCSPN